MAIKASIDIGTNATRLLVAQIQKGGIHPINMQERITRLGQGMEKTGCLTKPAMQRVCDALSEYLAICREHDVAEYRIFATSAVREAKNQGDFIRNIQYITGLQPKILSGEEEALSSFLGVKSDYKISAPVMVCDIGGGSTEFIRAENDRLLQSKSIAIGSRRFTAKFIKSDPATAGEILRTEQALARHLEEDIESMDTAIKECICVGGTATTLAMMAERIDISRAQDVHHHKLHKTDLLAIIERLSQLTLQQRKSITGLHPYRADIILTGALILKSLYDFFRVEQATIGIRDLLFGIFLL